MFELQPPDYIRNIAVALKLKSGQVQTAIRLFDEGNSIPFIARYRKEMTGELDENELREIASQYEFQKNLHQRKCDVLRLLHEQGVLSDDDLQSKLISAIQSAQTLTEVEDIYRPYRPKRKTRASIAKERGLEALAIWLKEPNHLRMPVDEVMTFAAQFVSEDKGVGTSDDALQGAADIVAEEIADDAETRKWLRTYTVAHGSIRSTAVNPDTESVYEAYYEFAETLSKTLPHRVLAMNRGEREEYLRVSIVAPQEEIHQNLLRRYAKTLLANGAATRINDDSFTWKVLRDAVVDAYKRLLAPAIEREIRTELTNRGEESAISVFGENLKNLLMQAPIRGKAVLGVDPAYRTGCKLAVVDDTGKLLQTSVIYPTPPQNKVEAAKQVVFDYLIRFDIDLIAIGNGTASRETEAFIADTVREYKELKNKSVPYVIVSEAGASVYSASPLAGEEFPDLDVSERSAISIARRIQDPLAELVKIDPKSVGVGQYQHDVSQKRLDEKLTAVVESAVNQVGVDLNTASTSLLSYVAGLNKTVAKNIVEFREQNGRFKSRKMLSKVPRLGPKTLEQCVGFLRIPDGEVLLDNTPIHPESYASVNQLLRRMTDPKEFFKDAEQRQTCIHTWRSVAAETLADEIGIGAPTLRDILNALERPGRDPREDVPPPILRTDVLKLEDLGVGMVLTGTVRNVVDFGAFVDVGIKNDGLVHISQLADRFVKHPMDVVSVGDVVTVKVTQIDANKGRLGLSMKGIELGENRGGGDLE